MNKNADVMRSFSRYFLIFLIVILRDLYFNWDYFWSRSLYVDIDFGTSDDRLLDRICLRSIIEPNSSRIFGVSPTIGGVQSSKVKSVQICTDCSSNLSRRPVNTDRVSILKYLIVKSAMHTWNILGNRTLRIALNESEY